MNNYFQNKRRSTIYRSNHWFSLFNIFPLNHSYINLFLLDGWVRVNKTLHIKPQKFRKKEMIFITLNNVPLKGFSSSWLTSAGNRWKEDNKWRHSKLNRQHSWQKTCFYNLNFFIFSGKKLKLPPLDKHLTCPGTTSITC